MKQPWPKYKGMQMKFKHLESSDQPKPWTNCPTRHVLYKKVRSLWFPRLPGIHRLDWIKKRELWSRLTIGTRSLFRLLRRVKSWTLSTRSLRQFYNRNRDGISAPAVRSGGEGAEWCAIFNRYCSSLGHDWLICVSASALYKGDKWRH